MGKRLLNYVELSETEMAHDSLSLAVRMEMIADFSRLLKRSDLFRAFVERIIAGRIFKLKISLAMYGSCCIRTSRHDVQLQWPMPFGDDKVVLEVKIPEDKVEFFSGYVRFLLYQNEKDGIMRQKQSFVWRCPMVEHEYILEMIKWYLK